MSTDFRGDPSAALLEVLDPEQNHTFNDHYLDLDYDLSNVMFITTANTLHGIPAPLQDRMEIIQLTGYTEFEKLTIAAALPGPEAAGGERPRRRATSSSPRTRSARSSTTTRARPACARLEREIGGDLPQGRARRAQERQGAADRGRPQAGCRSTSACRKFRTGKAEKEDEVGLATGLAWTELGGELLATEATVMPGKGKLDHHRQARRGDAGVGAGGDELRALARRALRPRHEVLREGRHPRPLPRGRDPQGRPVGGHHHGDRARLGAHEDPGAHATWR